MKALLAALFIALFALVPTSALAQSRPLVVAVGEVVWGDLATLEQPILIEGRVEGDVTSWSGPITVNGVVRGDVVSYVGPITLGPTAVIEGSVLSMAGGVAGPAAAVEGQLIGAEPVAGGGILAGLAMILGRQPATVAAEIPRPFISGVLTLIALAICGLMAAIWPVRTFGVARALRRAPWRSLGVGMLTTILLGLLLPPLGSLLAISLIGLPLLIPLLIVLQLPYLFGLAALGRLVTGLLSVRPLAPPVAAALGALIVLLPLASVAIYAPLAGAACFYAVAGIGLGAAILSRGGAYGLR